MRKVERIIWKWKPVAYLVARSKMMSLPGLEKLPVYDVWRFFLQQLGKSSLNERAAAISFNFLLAIPATTIFLLTLVPYLPESAEFHNELLRLTRDITPNQNTSEFLHKLIDDFLSRPGGGVLSFTFLLVLFYSSNAMMGVIRTFDRSLPEPEKIHFLRKRLRAIRLTTVVLFVFMGSILVLAGQDVLFRHIMDWLNIENAAIKWSIKNLRWVVIVALFLYSIAFIYKYAPSVKKRGRLHSPGAFFATFLTILTTWLFSLWVNNFGNFNRIYGSIGTVMILMILVFLNSLILLIGFELNMSIQYLKIKAAEREQKEIQKLAEKAAAETGTPLPRDVS